MQLAPLSTTACLPNELPQTAGTGLDSDVSSPVHQGDPLAALMMARLSLSQHSAGLASPYTYGQEEYAFFPPAQIPKRPKSLQLLPHKVAVVIKGSFCGETVEGPAHPSTPANQQVFEKKEDKSSSQPSQTAPADLALSKIEIVNELFPKILGNKPLSSEESNRLKKVGHTVGQFELVHPVTARLLKRINLYFPTVKNLHIAADLDDDAFKSIAHFKNLSELVIYNSKNKPIGAKQLDQCTQLSLQQLNVAYPKEDLLSTLPKFSQVTKVFFGTCQITTQDAVSVQKKMQKKEASIVVIEKDITAPFQRDFSAFHDKLDIANRLGWNLSQWDKFQD
jgi:hypothetical protein